MSTSNEQPEPRRKKVNVNDRAGILNNSALHPKLREGAEKPTPEELMEVLEELDADLKAKGKKK